MSKEYKATRSLPFETTQDPLEYMLADTQESMLSDYIDAIKQRGGYGKVELVFEAGSLAFCNLHIARKVHR